jgi:hypothetical protein
MEKDNQVRALRSILSVTAIGSDCGVATGAAKPLLDPSQHCHVLGFVMLVSVWPESHFPCKKETHEQHTAYFELAV